MKVREDGVTLESLRLKVFVLWMIFAIALTVTPLILFAYPRRATADTIIELVKQMPGLWLPAIACFASYWFSHANRSRASNAKVTRSEVAGCYGLTILYYFICFLAIGLILLVQNDPAPGTNDLVGGTLIERMAGQVAWVQLISPILLLPLGYITGKVPGAKRSDH